MHAESTAAENELDLKNALFFAFVHIMAVVALYYLIAVEFLWPTVFLAVVWYVCCILSITAGYHRLYSHKAYKARFPLHIFYLLFGSASFQSSILWWSAKHRVHHRCTDTPHDPHSIQRGLGWAHMGWLLRKGPHADLSQVRDLLKNPIIRLQSFNGAYLVLGITVGFIAPMLIGWTLWGDALGALLIAGFLRLVLHFHVTWSVNSLAHVVGRQTYSLKNSARNTGWWGWVLTLLTLGEYGWHSFHHRFPADYCNSAKWYQVDITKWFIWICSKLYLAYDLQRTSPEKIQQA